MDKKVRDVYFFGLIFLIVDQAIKFLVESKMVLHESIIVLDNFFSITLVHNLGAAFSILNGNKILLISVGVIAVLLLVMYINSCKALTDVDVFIYSLLLGGILGNLLDRILKGYVVDYLSFNFGNYYFPIFNFADICIVVSVLFMILGSIRGDLWK